MRRFVSWRSARSPPNRGNLAASTVQTAGFAAFNAQRAALVASGVRIFAAAPSVAQDLEPEYIAIAPWSVTAPVTLQGANAVAIVDIATATVTEIRPLGLKDYSRDSTSLETYTFANLPTLGTTAAGQAIPLGGGPGSTSAAVAWRPPGA